jgi:tripartite-type tricarboxylate transporter receptor subunit TctC
MPHRDAGYLMRIASRLLLLMIAVCAVPARAGAAPETVAEFYRGRQLTVLVGYGPGGSASFYAQALAHHMGRFLPGNPSLVVQHMPGAGGLLAANTLFNSAPRDGSVLAITGRTMAIEPLIGNPNAKFDGRKFNWLGTANVETTTCLAWHTSPVKTLQDAMNREWWSAAPARTRPRWCSPRR